MSFREDLLQFTPEGIAAFKKRTGIDLYAMTEIEKRLKMNTPQAVIA